MRDTPLFTALRTVLLTGFVGGDLANTKVLQLQQPTQIGAKTGPAIYFQKLYDVELGSPQRKSVWDVGAGDFADQMIQKVATTFQVSAIYKQTPDGLGATASDVANEAKAILQTDAAIAAFLFVGVGVERIAQVRNPPFLDGQGQFEFMPNFDFVLTHDQVTLSRTQRVTGVEFDLERV